MDKQLQQHHHHPLQQQQNAHHHPIIDFTEFQEHVHELQSIAGGGSRPPPPPEEDDLLDMLENSFKKFSSIIDNLEMDKLLPTKNVSKN